MTIVRLPLIMTILLLLALANASAEEPAVIGAADPVSAGLAFAGGMEAKRGTDPHHRP